MKQYEPCIQNNNNKTRPDYILKYSFIFLFLCFNINNYYYHNVFNKQFIKIHNIFIFMKNINFNIIKIKKQI